MIPLTYVLVGLVFWRTLTGHFVWEMHRSTRDRPTIRPPVEKWVIAAVPGFLLATVWPITLLFLIPWPFRRGAEKEAERWLGGIVDVRSALRSLETESDRLEQEVEEP